MTRRISASASRGLDDVAQTEGDGHGVEAVVGERQPGAVTRGEGQVRACLLADLQHPEREVARHHRGATVGEGLARGAGAGREVQDDVARARVDRADHLAAPAAVLAQRQHVVGDVVAARDRVEHPPDVGGLLVERCTDHGGSLRTATRRRRRGGATKSAVRASSSQTLDEPHLPRRTRCACSRRCWSPCSSSASPAPRRTAPACSPPSPPGAPPRLRREPVEEPASAVEPATDEADRDEPLPDADPAEPREPRGPVLAPGDRGVKVRELQSRLFQLAWFPELTTASYGPGTGEAVQRLPGQARPGGHRRGRPAHLAAAGRDDQAADARPALQRPPPRTGAARPGRLRRGGARPAGPAGVDPVALRRRHRELRRGHGRGGPRASRPSARSR